MTVLEKKNQGKTVALAKINREIDKQCLLEMRQAERALTRYRLYFAIEALKTGELADAGNAFHASMKDGVVGADEEHQHAVENLKNARR